ncbi:MAG: DUF2147 domain-containing protein [Bacteroidota bacterium]
MSVSLNAQQSVEGIWKAIDDNDGAVTSHIEIYVEQGELHGKIVDIFEREKDVICVPCKGDKKDQPVMGMEIIWGLRQKKDTWKGGKIMDPENGKTYKCKISLDPQDADVLEVRGFIGMSVMGRTQRWVRL